jgi:hypothetical protein
VRERLKSGELRPLCGMGEVAIGDDEVQGRSFVPLLKNNAPIALAPRPLARADTGGRARSWVTSSGRGPVAQGIEQQPSKLKVAGSNPAGVATAKTFPSNHNYLLAVLSNRIRWLDNFSNFLFSFPRLWSAVNLSIACSASRR